MRSARWVRVLVPVTLALAVMTAGCGGSGDEGAGSTAGSADGKGDDVLVLDSSAFDDGAPIPASHATTKVSGGLNVSVPLEWGNAPSGTASYALAMVDRHPAAGSWVHWLVVDLPPTLTELEEGASGGLAPPARELRNTFGFVGYGGPQPPPGSGEHDYEVTVYALDTARLDIPERASLADFERAIAGKVLAQASVTGTFRR